MSLPLVSVVIPAYNCEKYIKETIFSVLNQTYSNIEVVLVDDGSTDRTAEIVQQIAEKDSRLIYMWEKNAGVSAARNKAIRNSKGEFTALLDHDDLWLPQKLERQIPIFNNNSKTALVFSDAYYFDDDHPVLFNHFSKNKPCRGKVFRELFRRNFIPCLTVVLKTKILEGSGYFAEDMDICEEYDLFLRIAYRYEVDYINMPLAKYRVHETNFSKNVELGIKEGFMLIQNCIHLIPDFEQAFSKELAEKRAELSYLSGKNLWCLGENGKARYEFLKSIKKRLSFRSFFLYALSFFNYRLFLVLGSLRNKFLRWKYNLIVPKKQ